MKKSILLFSSVSLCLTFIFSLGFSIDGDKKPFGKTDIEGPNVVNGPELENPTSNLYQSFESTNFPPPGWKKINPLGGTGWTRQTAGTSPMPGWNGGVITTPPGGQSAIAYCTWNTSGSTSTDQWLVTPKITNILDNDSLCFFIKFPGYSHNYQDFVEILISTTGSSTGSFHLVHTLFWPAGSNDTSWTRRAFKITDFPGVTAGSNIFIAFREKVINNYEEGAAIFLDLVEIVTTLTNIQQISPEIPDSYNLSQNYPNPFNPSTNINFSIVDKGFVSLKVYDMLGREVANLVNKELISGSYTYNFDANRLNSGIYFYKLQTENFAETKKMMLVK